MEILNKKQKIIVVVLIIIMCIVIGYYIISKTEKYDYSDIEKISAWKDINIVYDTLSKQNKNLANLLARKINAELHNKLKIAKMIGS